MNILPIWAVRHRGFSLALAGILSVVLLAACNESGTTVDSQPTPTPTDYGEQVLEKASQAHEELVRIADSWPPYPSNVPIDDESSAAEIEELENYVVWFKEFSASAVRYIDALGELIAWIEGQRRNDQLDEAKGQLVDFYCWLVRAIAIERVKVATMTRDDDAAPGDLIKAIEASLEEVERAEARIGVGCSA